jgi:type I restriction enzyme M protein
MKANRQLNQTASAIAHQVWNYAHVLRDDGLGFIEYTEQITYLLFIKLASERRGLNGRLDLPARYTWQSLSSLPQGELKTRYEQALKNLSRKPGLLGLIFTKPQSKIEDPAKLRHLMKLIDNVDWSSLDIDVKGAIYESLLARNSEDVRGGAGQYFTPRPVIRAIVEVMRPLPGMIVADPAAGTGGFLLAAYAWIKNLVTKGPEDEFLRTKGLRGTDIVANVARLCMMNLYLHGIGDDPNTPPITIGDSLAHAPDEAVSMVLTNPPFGKKSTTTAISDGRRISKNQITYSREDFWATTSNKQLNFVQHVYSMLEENGKAAIVVPDNVLFESGAGERIRRELLSRADVHTLLRLPTGIWYSAGVKANVLFFDKKRSISKELWIYDLRTNKNFTLRNNPIASEDLNDFVECYSPENHSKRVESARFKCFSHAHILAGERASLDLLWLSDDSYSDPRNLESHELLAAEVVTLLKQAVREFEAAVGSVGKPSKVRR